MAGDQAYDLHVDEGAVGDAYLNAIEPIAASTAWMTTPGNHESRPSPIILKMRRYVSSSSHAPCFP